MREQAGQMFDPELLEHFFNILPTFLDIQQQWSIQATAQH
jgi:response regulator RpfG family c-di-GMP phosphodiesterase